MNYPFNTIDYDATEHEDDDKLVGHVCHIFPPADANDRQIIALAKEYQKLAYELGFGYPAAYDLTDAKEPTLQFEFEAPVAEAFLAALEARGWGKRTTPVNYYR